MTAPRAVGAGQDGTVTIWSMGLVLLLLTIGWVSLDLWHVVSQRQALVGAADAAVIAAASALDPDGLRQGSVQIAPALAERRAAEALATLEDPGPLESWQFAVTADGQVAIAVDGRVRTVLLRLLGVTDLSMTVTARSAPRLAS